jgi:hypothetical protein
MKTTCSSCRQAGAECVGSSSDSGRCSECVRLNLARCDANGLSPQQLRKIAAQHTKFESELEAAEEARRAMDAKVERLRKQKKLWFEKMMRAVSRGIDDVEELERVEREEAEREQRRSEISGSSAARSSTEDVLDPDFMSTWDAVYAHVPLDPALLETFGVVGGTASAGAGNSSSA